MPALLQSTENALGGSALANCQSRALRLTRYARPDLKVEHRKAYLVDVIRSQREPRASACTIAWQSALPAARQLHARLEARLLINTGGTVLENAGLNLDRYGTSYLPGSAVKACARRIALATLREWCAGDPAEKPVGDHLLAPVAAPFDQPADLLLAILRVFGCTDLEWESYDHESDKGNDLAWACGDCWAELREQVRAPLLSAIGYSVPAMRDEAAPTLRGSVAFLPSYPLRAPLADLELDVLTPHHKAYYESDDTHAVALDTEDPVPIVFPAVAAGADYAFTLVPLYRDAGDASLLDHAATWLLTGLTTFGLGGKTNAGYGWFKDVTAETNERLAKEAAAARAAAEARVAEEKRQAELAARKAREATLASMTPSKRADAELAELIGDKGRLKMHLARFAESKPEKQLTSDEKAAVLRWFAAEGPGRDLWLNEIKVGQGKTKDVKVWKQIVGYIHAAKKTLTIDLP